MDFEQSFANFSGVGSERISREDVINTLVSLFDNALYKDHNGNSKDEQIDKVYTSNQQFWEDCLSNKLTIGKTIQLKDFPLIEWLPYSPGLYFTEGAKGARKRAGRFISKEGNEYLPLGKLQMMLGGIGSVRLADRENKHFLCASSTGFSHQGIPLITDRRSYNALIDEIKQEGYTTVDIVGTIELLSTERSIINYAREVPRYCVSVKSIMKTKKIETEVSISVSAVFGLSNNSNKTERHWSFASFTPDPGEKELERAVEWIERYATRYSDGTGRILSDFDEHKAHFTSDIEFKLKDVINGEISEETLFKYSEHFKIVINKTVMGDNIEHNSGNIIKGNTGNVFASVSGDINIENSFNKVKDTYGEDAAKVLMQAAAIIDKEDNQDAKEQFASFKEELEKEKPKKSILKALWEGIAVAVPLIKTSVEIFDKGKVLFGF